MAILFISSLTPDRQEYWTNGFARSGFNAIQGVGLSMANIIGNESIEFFRYHHISRFQMVLCG